MSLGIVDKALTYITVIVSEYKHVFLNFTNRTNKTRAPLQHHAPSMKSTFWRTDSNDWKEYISKPALKYILRFLTGLANEHKPTQVRTR